MSIVVWLVGKVKIVNKNWQGNRSILRNKKAVFWDVAPFRYCVNRRFGGTYRLHIQSRRKNKIREEPA
jgi:hypothetical protein